MDGVEECEGASLLGIGRSGDLEGWRVVTVMRGAAGVADDGGELLLEGAEAVRGGAVVEEMRGGLGLGGGGACGGSHRIPRGLGALILVGKEQGTPGLSHVPLDVVGEHAEENVASDAIGEMVVDRADLQVDGFQRAEGPLDLGQ